MSSFLGDSVFLFCVRGFCCRLLNISFYSIVSLQLILRWSLFQKWLSRQGEGGATAQAEYTLNCCFSSKEFVTDMVILVMNNNFQHALSIR
jgi:hypothetical protein